MTVAHRRAVRGPDVISTHAPAWGATPAVPARSCRVGGADRTLGPAWSAPPNRHEVSPGKRQPLYPHEIPRPRLASFATLSGYERRPKSSLVNNLAAARRWVRSARNRAFRGRGGRQREPIAWRRVPNTLPRPGASRTGFVCAPNGPDSHGITLCNFSVFAEFSVGFVGADLGPNDARETLPPAVSGNGLLSAVGTDDRIANEGQPGP